MAKQFESWVHGYAAVAEWMGTDRLQSAVDPTRSPPEPDFVPAFSEVNGWRRACGAFFRLVPHRDNWFHIAIPTPVLVEDRRAGLDRVMALFRIDNGFLQRVLVFDGPNPIFDSASTLGALHVSGDQLRGRVDNANVFHVDHDGINSGIGFSLNFSASQDPQDQAPADLYIASAGGIFFHNI